MEAEIKTTDLPELSAASFQSDRARGASEADRPDGREAAGAAPAPDQPLHPDCTDASPETAAEAIRPLNGKLRAIIFDCDDTLAFTERIAQAVSHRMVQSLFPPGVVPSQLDQYKTEIHGLALPEVLAQYAKKAGRHFSAADIRELVDAEMQEVIKAFRWGVQPTDGVRDLLQSLNEEDYRLAVCSSSPRPRVREALEMSDLSGAIDPEMVFSAQTLFGPRYTKPKPEIYRHAFHQIGRRLPRSEAPLREQECLAVEDSTTGVAAAVTAKLPCVGYLGSAEPGQAEARARELIHKGAWLVVREMFELKEVVDLIQRGELAQLERRFRRPWLR